MVNFADPRVIADFYKPSSAMATGESALTRDDIRNELSGSKSTTPDLFTDPSIIGPQFDIDKLEAKIKARDMPWYQVLAKSMIREGEELVQRPSEAMHRAFGGEEAVGRYKVDMGRKRRDFRPIQEERPVLSFGGAMAPYIYPGAKLYQGAQAAVKGATATRPLAQNLLTKPAVLGAGTGAAEGAGGAYLKKDDPLMGALLGSAFGYGGGKLGQWATKTVDKLTPQMQQVVSYMDDWGLISGPGERSNIRRLQTIDADFNADLKTMDTADAIEDYNKRVINRRILSEAGIDADNLSTTTIADTYRDYGDQFEDLIRRSDVTIDNTFIDNYNEAWRQYDLSYSGESKAVETYKRKLLNIVQGADNNQISGERFQVFYSDISDTIKRKAGATDSKTKNEFETLTAMRNSIDDLVERSLPAEQREASSLLRRRYAAMKLFEEGRAINTATGEIDLGSLHNVLMKPRNSKAFLTGQGPFEDLYKAAKIGKYKAEQPGASLQSRQQFSKATKNPAEDDTSFGQHLRGKHQNLKAADSFQAMLHRAGYPDLTGGLFMPNDALPYFPGAAVGAGMPTIGAASKVYNFVTGEYE